jgi:hypothetical protein
MGSALRPWEEFRMRFTEEIMRPIEFRCQERIQFFFDDIASCVNAGAEVCV